MNKVIPLLAFSILLLIPLAADDAFAVSFDVIYTADTLPETAGFSEFNPPIGNAGCTLREILPGGVYHFTSADNGLCVQTADVWSADSNTGFTVEFRTKINSYSGLEGQAGLAVFATALDSEQILILRENSILAFWGANTHAMDTVSNFHTYRITIEGNSYTVYVDGVSVLTGGTGILNRNLLLFGDSSNGAGGDAEWDCVAYTTTGAFSPTELAPACVNSSAIGGEIIPIEQTSLILAGAQSFSWMIPVVLSGIGIGVFVVSRKSG